MKQYIKDHNDNVVEVIITRIGEDDCDLESLDGSIVVKGYRGPVFSNPNAKSKVKKLHKAKTKEETTDERLRAIEKRLDAIEASMGLAKEQKA